MSSYFISHFTGHVKLNHVSKRDYWSQWVKNDTKRIIHSILWLYVHINVQSKVWFLVYFANKLYVCPIVGHIDVHFGQNGNHEGAQYFKLQLTNWIVYNIPHTVNYLLIFISVTSRALGQKPLLKIRTICNARVCPTCKYFLKFLDCNHIC